MKGKKLVLSLLCIAVLLTGVVGCAAPDPILDIYTQDVLPGTNDDYKVGEQTNPYYEGWFENLYFNGGVVGGDLTVNGNVSAYYYFGSGEYLTDIRDFEITLYLLNESSPDVANNRTMSLYQIDPEITLTGSLLPAGDTLLATWVSNQSIPSIEEMQGNARIHLSAKLTGGTKSTQLYATLWKTNESGADLELIGTSEYTNALSSTREDYRSWIVVNPVVFNESDRLRLRLYAYVSGLGNAPSIEYYIQDDSESRLVLPYKVAAVGTISVGTTTTLPAGSNASVNNSGTPWNAIFNFGIPISPNFINTSTGTDLTGYLYGNGSNVTVASNSVVLAGTQESFTTVLKNGLDWLIANITSAWKTTVDTHLGNTSNPHGVTKDQVGLGNVLNATQVVTSEFDAKGDILVGTGDDVYDNLPVGSNGQVLMANSSASMGVNWATMTAFTPGMMMMYGAAVAPDGWLLCDGSAVSRTTYANLYAILGDTYGNGDGSTTFNLPDMSQRMPMGLADSGTGSVLGEMGGEVDHTHDSHTTISVGLLGLLSSAFAGPTTHSPSNQAYTVVNFIIKY